MCFHLCLVKCNWRSHTIIHTLREGEEVWRKELLPLLKLKYFVQNVSIVMFQSLQELRNSLQEMLQQSPQNTQPHDSTFPLAEPGNVEEEEGSVCEQCEQCEQHDDEECGPYQPPEYHSLLRHPPPPPGTDSAPRPPRHMSSFKPQQRSTPDIGKKSLASTASADHIPRSHERLPDHIPRSHERLPYHRRDHHNSSDSPIPAVGTVPSPALYIPEPEHDSPAIVPPSPEPPVHREHSLQPGERLCDMQNSPIAGERYDSNPPHSPAGARYDSNSPSAGAHYDSDRPYLARQYDALPPEHYEQIQQDILESEQSQSSSSHRSKRRRRKQRSSQQTTDQSSNGKCMKTLSRRNPSLITGL